MGVAASRLKKKIRTPYCAQEEVVHAHKQTYIILNTQPVHLQRHVQHQVLLDVRMAAEGLSLVLMPVLPLLELLSMLLLVLALLELLSMLVLSLLELLSMLMPVLSLLELLLMLLLVGGMVVLWVLQVLLGVPLKLMLVYSLHLHLGCWWALSLWESVSHASDVPFSHCEAQSCFLLCCWCLHVAIAQLVLCWLPLALRHFLLELLLVLQVLLGLEPLRSGLMPLALQLLTTWWSCWCCFSCGSCCLAWNLCRGLMGCFWWN